MRSFKNHSLLTEFVENLFEYTIATKDKGSYATWGSKKFPPPSWVVKGFADAGIVISDTTTFQIADGKPEDKDPKIGDSEKVVAYTNVYDISDITKPLGKVAWMQNPENYFKKLEAGTDLVWGSNTDALETAACMGVYLDADKVLADEEKKGIAVAREEWNPIIKKILNESHDWDKGGVSKLVSKMDDMSDVNWRVMILISKGMRNFIKDEAKTKIGTDFHIIHGRIQDYYAAEKANQTVTGAHHAPPRPAGRACLSSSAAQSPRHRRRLQQCRLGLEQSRRFRMDCFGCRPHLYRQTVPRIRLVAHHGNHRRPCSWG